MGQSTTKTGHLNNKNYSGKKNSINNISNNNGNNTSNKKNNNNKIVNVSLSTTKCKYCEKNYVPNKVLRSHLYYCVDCYLKKKI